MFFWVDDALFPWDFAFYTQGSLPRDDVIHTQGSFSMEDAELINENRIPIQHILGCLLCHDGHSRNYFQASEGKMDLFSVVHLSKPKLVTEGVRPLRDGEEPLLESTAGRTMELVLEQPEVESTDVLAPTPLRSVPGATVEPPRLDATSVGSSEDADVAGAESEAGEVDSGLKRKEGTNVEATSDSSTPVTHAVQSPPQTSPLTADDISRRDRGTGPKAFEGVFTSGSLMSELICWQYAQDDLAESSTVLCLEACEEKGTVCQGGKNYHFAGLDDVSPESGGLFGEAEGRSYANLVLSMYEGFTLPCWYVLLGCAGGSGWEELHDEKSADSACRIGLTLARHATEGAVAQPADYFSSERGATGRGPRHKLAKKKGVKGKAILCGVGAAHIPRSDGVPVSVATVSPKDRELLGKLKEAGDAAYQVAVSEQSRCHSI
ncbi:hypothetical protein Tco_0708312 [Tanacetum coccineum]